MTFGIAAAAGCREVVRSRSWKHLHPAVVGTGGIGAGRRSSFRKHLGKHKVLILFGFFF